MSTLRKSIIASIIEDLDKSYYGIDNFDISFPDSGGTLVSIKFIPYPSYSFEIKEPYTGSPLSTYETPGQYKRSDEISNSNFDQCAKGISRWVSRIKEELSSVVPTMDDVNTLRDQVEQHIKEHIDDPEERFTAGEIDEINERLNRLTSQFEELQKKNEITEEQLTVLKNQINDAQRDVKTYPKGAWYRSSANKLLGVIKKVSNSKEGRLGPARK